MITDSLDGVYLNEESLYDPTGLVASLRTLTADQPPLILHGELHKLSSKLTSHMLSRFLSQEERRRIESFHRLGDRQRFGIARAMLRGVLGCWHSTVPCSVTINTSPYGKPYCREGPFFNISHSGDRIGLAMHPCRMVGIDIEQIRHYGEWKEMASIIWPNAMIRRIERLSTHDQSKEFLRQWCQYEASTKAIGLGLSATRSIESPEKSCKIWRLALPRLYLGYVAMA